LLVCGVCSHGDDEWGRALCLRKLSTEPCRAWLMMTGRGGGCEASVATVSVACCGALLEVGGLEGGSGIGKHAIQALAHSTAGFIVFGLLFEAPAMLGLVKQSCLRSCTQCALIGAMGRGSAIALPKVPDLLGGVLCHVLLQVRWEPCKIPWCATRHRCSGDLPSCAPSEVIPTCAQA
jgi:hypothetical protein